MTTTGTHQSPARHQLVITLAAAALLALASLASSTAAPRASAASSAGDTACGGSYRWPVKPFNRPHPVRANFGDPRTTFQGPPTLASLLTSAGEFSFHFGIDISVPDGTPVYAVRSGRARTFGRWNVAVDSGHGFTTQYWHIVTAIRPGQNVTAHETILGRVQKGYEHVHFSELRGSRPVNPLAPGHLGPYQEHAAPQVTAISFRVGRSTQEGLPERLSRTIVPVAQVQDQPALPVPGLWRDLPVAPALLTWHIERAKDGRDVVRRRVAFDVRQTLPQNASFWSYYARGSRQNMCTFGTQRAWRTPGTYLYRLVRDPFDTRALSNGIYRFVVTATDVRGNSASHGQVFIVRNGAQT